MILKCLLFHFWSAEFGLMVMGYQSLQVLLAFEKHSLKNVQLSVV